MTQIDSDFGELIIMAKKRLPSSRSYFPVKIDIPSFSGGVGRSSPTKRIPMESENVDNFIVSLEHSAEKRRGVELLKQVDAALIGRLAGISELPDTTVHIAKDFWYHWFLVSSTTKYLIVIDYKADATDLDRQLLWVYKVNESGELSEEIREPVSEATREYITYGHETNTAKDTLRAVAVGSSLLILNTQVKAGYTSSEKGSIDEGLLRGMDGESASAGDDDKQGKILEYLTSSTVDVKTNAEIWNKFSHYIAGDQVYCTDDFMNTDVNMVNYNATDPAEWMTSYDHLRSGLWQVSDKAADIVGPDDSGLPPREPFAGIDKGHMNYGSLQGNIAKPYIYIGSFSGGSPTSKAVCPVLMKYPSGAKVGEPLSKADILSEIEWLVHLDGSGTTGYGNHFALPYWVPNRRYDDNHQGDYDPSPSDSDSYEKIRFWLDSSSFGNQYGTGWDQKGYKYDGGDMSTVLWDPDPSNTSTYQPDPLQVGAANQGAIYCRIYTERLDSVQDLVEHVSSALNWYRDQGLISVTTTPNAGLNGWEWECVYHTQQWERVPKDPLPPAFEDLDILDEIDAAYEGGEDADTGEGWAEYTDFMKASDYYYPNPEHKYLGQAVSALSDLKFPPHFSDLTAFNGSSDVTDMLVDLYPDEGDSAGAGKLYYLSQNYSGLSEGHFRVKDVDEQPYLHKIRTPEAMSIIDKRRMPMQLVLDENYTFREYRESDLNTPRYGTCDADVNGDGNVDVLDIIEVIVHWGERGENIPADINNDGVVNLQDLLKVIQSLGPCPAAHFPYKLKAADIGGFGVNPEDFGTNLVLDGDRLLIGASRHNHDHVPDSGSHPWEGAIYYYEFDGVEWVELQEITHEWPETLIQFGTGVALSGDKFLGSNQFNITNTGTGEVTCFHYDAASPGAKPWEQGHTFISPAPYDSGDLFGCSIAIDGDVAVIGASHRINGDDLRVGRAYVYRYSESEWTLEAELKASVEVPWDGFGNVVKIDGDKILVGARGFDLYGQDIPNDEIGAAFSFVYDHIDQSWGVASDVCDICREENQKITGGTGLEGDNFGKAIDIDGDIAVISGKGGHDLPNGATVTFYDYDSATKLWTAGGVIETTDEDGNAFGTSISVQQQDAEWHKGEVAVSGSAYHGLRGRAHIIQRLVDTDEPDGYRFVSTHYTVPSHFEPQPNDLFGYHISLSGNRFAAGSEWNNHLDGDSCDRCGAAFVFQKNTNSFRNNATMDYASWKSVLDLAKTKDVSAANLISSEIGKRFEETSLLRDGDDPTWRFKQVDWDPRDSGGVISNPGPSIFHDGDGKAIQRSLSAMSYYRGRLFLASEDILVSSRINDFDNFWINDPDTLSVADPIDLRVSSNAYTPITYLQPYRNFLFLATDGGIQYELLGSENQISPLTAEIAPTSFYNMTLDVNPVLLNNSLFFLDARRLYIYFGEQTEAAQNAIDISINAQGYLPESFEDITTSAATNSIFLVDKDTKNHVYCYTNRISGDQIAQNSFFRFIFPEGWTIRSIVGVEEYLYLVWEEEIVNSDNEDDTWTSINAGRIYLRNQDLYLPRLDSLMHRDLSDMDVAPQTQGSGDDMETYFTIQSPTTDLDTIILWNDEDPNVRGIKLDIKTCVPADPDDYPGGVIVTVGSDHRSNLSASGGFYMGKSYTANIELSPVFLRDENLDAQNGALNLRLGMFRYRNSGDFSVSIQRKSRDAVTLPYTIDTVDDSGNLLDYKPFTDYGIFKVPVLGFSHDLKMNITSTSVHPITLSDVEFTGKFKYKLNSLGAQ